MNDLITTTEAARIAGVGVTSIKRWADQALIRVSQTPGGHRRISRRDLERFLAQSSNRAVTNRRHNGATQAPLPRTDIISDAAMYWADTILRSDTYTLQGALLSARGRTGSWHAASDEAVHGLAEIGRRWGNGVITSLEEHVASERLAQALAMLALASPRTMGDATCLLTCPEGERHTLGLSFLRLCLHEAGWNTLWVGASVPTHELCATASSGELSMIALSTSEAFQDRAHLAQITHDVGTACDVAGTKLVLGGRGAWPDPPSHGRRFHAYTPFHHYLLTI